MVNGKNSLSYSFHEAVPKTIVHVSVSEQMVKW